jgi:hypothetical protein
MVDVSVQAAAALLIVDGHLALLIREIGEADLDALLVEALVLRIYHRFFSSASLDFGLRYCRCLARRCRWSFCDIGDEGVRIISAQTILSVSRTVGSWSV